MSLFDLPTQIKSLINHKQWLIFLLIMLLAGFLRIYQLDSVPRGLHQDEAWFAYNAMLLKESGKNIYGQAWPLSVDMWGEQVPAVHSYLMVPFITLFGANYYAFRLPIVFCSLLTIPLLIWLIKRLTGQNDTSLLAGLLYAVSPWNLIMSRASSTVIIDTFLVMSFLSLAVLIGDKIVSVSKQKKRQWYLIGSLALYGLSIVAYFTYFTSRLVLPIMLLLLMLYGYLHRFKHNKLVLSLFGLVLVLYLIFPFGVMLKTPYALGRYQETTVINGPLVQNALFHNIAYSGQSNMPVWITRSLFNKVSVNANIFIRQYLAFFSPSVVLYQTSPPIRYDVPNTGVTTWYEYLGLLAAVGLIFFGYQKKSSPIWWTSWLFLAFLAASLIPTALTIDDFPNFQRGVIATPFWQITSAIGIMALLHKIRQVTKPHRQKLVHLLTLLTIVIIISLQLGGFYVSYFKHGPYANLYNRSRAGEKLAEWILTNRPQASFIMDHDEASFLYYYIYGQKNVLQMKSTRTGPFYLTSEAFSFDQHYYYRELCSLANFSDLISQKKPELIIVKVFPGGKDRCMIPSNYKLIEKITFDDGTVGYEVWSMHIY